MSTARSTACCSSGGRCPATHAPAWRRWRHRRSRGVSCDSAPSSRRGSARRGAGCRRVARSGGRLDLDRVEAEQQVLAEATAGDLGVDVGVRARERTRTSTAQRLRRARRAANSPVCSTRSSFGLETGAMFARSRREQRAAVGELEAAHAGRSSASVNAPLTWPNSSLSATPSESPPSVDGDEGSRARLRPPYGWTLLRRPPPVLPSRALTGR